ncbi:MAG: M23 family metallopeptidase [Alphaproteobacteria bacterium]|nr:M23 family metallopeptidase [Alphaproteobacteria bacterium]
MWLRWFVLMVCGIGTAYAGFLQPTSFPKTVDDLSFAERMALRKAGYDQFETLYDENGRCISGCAYAQLNLEDELAAMERWNRLSRRELVEQHGYTENPDGTVTPPPVPPRTEFPDQPPTQPNTPPSAPPSSSDGCPDKNTAFANRDIPYGNPLGYMACISSPYGPRKIFGKTSVHHGVDFRAAIGTPVYAPANGTVAVVFVQNETCGNGVVIKHSNGYSTKYCHFDSVSVKKGDKVSSGCLIGKTGNTGRSTGPHLHYSVIKDGESINPADFIEPGHERCQ